MTDEPVRDRGSGRLIFVLVGAVGSGKGTQAGALAREFGLASIASGNLFRAALAAGTPLGESAREYMEAGELVPDDLTIAMIMEELAKPAAAAGAVFDGFPRTVGQANALDQTLAETGENVDGVFYIDVPTEVLVRRVAGRWVCPTCGTPYHDDTKPPRMAGVCDKDGSPLRQRDDDRPEVVRARLAKQVPPMLAVIDHYGGLGLLDRIDGERSIDEVTTQILERARARAGRGG